MHFGSGFGLFIATALAISAGPALSADLPVVVPTKTKVVAANHDWSGFYLGGHFGYSRGNFDVSSGTTASGSFGALYLGVQAGYNYMLSSHWLIGVEADM